ncbi:UNVERIFIED_CONTAM: Retrovirus-related Pol polyprotein from type-2 retrotransposable element R2DM [Sesamum indicum]
MFRFDNYLTHSPDFIPSVQNIWQHEVVGVPMYAVSRKLKALKPVFRQQRRNKGDLTLNVQLAKGFLEEAQNLVSSDRQNELFLFLEHCCRLVYAKAAKLEQIMLQQRAKMQWMKGGDQCSRIFFCKIAQRRAVRRILQINDENGTTHTESSEVVHEFVSFYQNFLGGNRRRLLVDINYLRPWARHILSNEEASHLSLPFSPEDVKQAIFDIVEDKAPGPDGFSSGFFKAAWPIVGTEVTRAVLDFFTTGKLLKQVNSTLLALIPKVHTPMSVNDFRPISCCNVLYKVIAKLLVQRLSVVLDKLISPCQAAFILGRSIEDNIMLAQELFTGYNQIHLPPRCALKVDISKAYDTVECDFLVAILQFFNFPTTFIRCIEECITTASFPIGLNGKPHGFFNGARGLRQGDPLSPYLFVLVMEKCEPARVFQLGFADDLLLFCRADMDSIRVFKMGLDRFVEWSGLRLNVQKSHLIISRSAQDRKEQMLAVLGFQEGHLPMRYLGLPLLSSRLSISDCQPLVSKIDARITRWEGISLSYVGRVQIIKFVLSTLSLHWASAFILPKAVIKEVEKHLRTFLWKGTSMTGYAKVAWKDVCKPVEEGGLGIKDIGILNRVLMTKKSCDVIRCDRTSIWVEWLQHGRLQNNSIWTVGEQGGSWGWRKLLRLHSYIQPMVELRIGDGDLLSLEGSMASTWTPAS